MSPCSANPYLPIPVIIDKITIENEARDLKTFRLAFCKDTDAENFEHKCGQFAMLSVPEAGEIPIGIASSPLERGYVEFTVKKYSTGVVTSELHNMEEGAKIGIRGPFGNGFPMQELEGKNIVIASGGFAFTTLRATIKYLLNKDKRALYGDITAIYGARNPGELLYKQELKDWENQADIKMHVTVDNGDESWQGKQGFVPAVLSEVAPKSDNAVALICGPPAMLRFTMQPIIDLGFKPESIYTSLERRMSCGIGKCGRCNIGSKYVCKDGPVFSYAEILKLPEKIF